MAMIPAKCTNCGANIQVDESKEAGICEACGTAFITEKAINNYNITNNYNIENANINVSAVDIDAKIAAAERLVKNGFLSDAQNMLYKLIEDFPEDYRAYFLFAKNAYEYRNVSLEDDEYFIKARALADEDGIKIIDKYYSEYKAAVYGKSSDIVELCEKAQFSQLYYCYLKWYWSDSLNENCPHNAGYVGYGYWGFEPVNGIPTVVVYTKHEKYGFIRHVDDTCNYNLIAKVHNKKLVAIVTKGDSCFVFGNHTKHQIHIKWKNRLISDTCHFYITHLNEGKVIYNNAPEDMVYGDVFRSQSTDFEKTNIGKGCYVATCVYGSYDCPEVWTLRRFRDNTLASTWYGRAFIRAYYAVSPTIVKWFGDKQWFKKLWKGRLDALVNKLQSNGVKSTPYADKIWR